MKFIREIISGKQGANESDVSRDDDHDVLNLGAFSLSDAPVEEPDAPLAPAAAADLPDTDQAAPVARGIDSPEPSSALWRAPDGGDVLSQRIATAILRPSDEPAAMPDPHGVAPDDLAFIRQTAQQTGEDDHGFAGAMPSDTRRMAPESREPDGGETAPLPTKGTAETAPQADADRDSDQLHDGSWAGVSDSNRQSDEPPLPAASRDAPGSFDRDGSNLAANNGDAGDPVDDPFARLDRTADAAPVQSGLSPFHRGRVTTRPTRPGTRLATDVVPPVADPSPIPAAAPAEMPAPAAGRAARRAGRVKTRLLGFGAAEAARNPFDVADKGSSPHTRFPVGWLVVIAGPGRGESFALGAGVSQIGRGEDQAVCLDFGDTSISRQNHAAVAYDGEQRQFYLGHGGKANLVRLDGRPVLSTEELPSGGEIQIGETRLRFVALCGAGFDWDKNQDEDIDTAIFG